MKNYTSPGCKFNPEGVQCDPNGRHCESCGHNPAVAAARLQKIHPGYFAATNKQAAQIQSNHHPRLAPRDPAITEALLSGNWGCPDNG